MEPVETISLITTRLCAVYDYYKYSTVQLDIKWRVELVAVQHVRVADQ